MALVLDLAPFTLKAPAGRGGMAEVWKGAHAGRGTPVAIKVMTALDEEHGGARRRFVEEVRAVARLDHPGIIRLHDYGTVPARIAQNTGGLLPADAPYLVMDWHGGGTLSEMRGKLDFAGLRGAILALLDALAHAHARGVIHRDLKPANVLLGERGPVLTDFGVVFSLDLRVPPEKRVAGTPNYMAPEQVINDWRAFGPWTDLYALGCMAWALVCGRAPYAGRGAVAAMQGHVAGALPAFRPRRPVPDGFELWLRRMLARHPRQRFRHAADAAVALMALPDGADEGADALPQLTEDEHTLVAPPRFVAIDETAWAGGPALDRRPPMPIDWRRSEDAPAPTPLPGCGRALVELREPGMRGRGAVRDLLWSRLGAVVEGAGARAVILDGEAGIGKSRLATWVGRRAHELGQADRIVATHGPTPGPTHGPGPMLSRRLRLDGLGADDAAARVDKLFDLEPVQVAAVAAAVHPTREAGFGGVRVRLEGESERLVALADGLMALAEYRPLVVHVDDAQWGDEALRLVGYVLSKRPDLPALFVITVRPGDLSTDRLAPALLDALAARPEVDRFTVGVLPPGDHGALSAARLSLERSTLDRLVETTRGNPLFAIELLRHWLQTDALVETPHGAALRTDRPVPLPPDLIVLWRARVDALLSGLSSDPLPALELAAVGGIEVDEAEWASARQQVGLERPDAAVERLLDVGLAVPTGAGRWAFAHGMLRDALERRSGQIGRRARWHRAWADGLTALAVATGLDADPERLAGHHTAGGDHGRALPKWLEAARLTATFSDMATAGRAVMAAARSGRALRADRGSADWTRIRIIWAEYLFASSRPGAPRHGKRALAAARALGQPDLECRAYMALGTVISARSRADAVPVLEAACAVAEHALDPLRRARSRRRLGLILMGLGRFDEAEACLGQAEAYDRALDDQSGLGLTLRHQSELALARGDLERAGSMARASLARYRQTGNRFGQAASSTVIGEVARKRGRLEEAEAAYQDAWRVLEGIDHVDAAVLAINLSLLSVAREDWPMAYRRAAWVRARTIRAQHAVYRSVAESVLLVCAARDGDAAAWDDAWGGLGPALDLRFTEVDVARCLGRAATMAAASLPERAGSARTLAIRQYRALGRAPEADALERG